MTPIQAQVLRAIRDLSSDRVSPSVRAIVRHINASGVSVVHQALVSLRDKGIVTWADGEARSLRIIAEGPSRAAMERWSDDEIRRVQLDLQLIQCARSAKGRAAA